jgi:6-phosphogluconolactonase/glucosamine-6-phosphate isomerase/deaminase
LCTCSSSKAIKARDRFVVAFSGGSLPEIVGKGLLASNRIIDYSKW